MCRHFLIPIDGMPATQKAAKVGNALGCRIAAKMRVGTIDKRSEEVGVPFILRVAN